MTLSTFCLILCLAGPNTAPPAVEAQTLGGETFSGSIVELSDERITLETASGTVSLELQRLAGVNPKAAPTAAKVSGSAWIGLVDGSTLIASEYTVHEGRARIALLSGQILEFPTQDISDVRLQPRTEALDAEW